MNRMLSGALLLYSQSVNNVYSDQCEATDELGCKLCEYRDT